MRIEFLDAVAADTQIAGDVCLVGSGPAALTIARELENLKIRVVMVEAGGFDLTDDPDRGVTVENVGARRIADLPEVRTRIFGGTSHVWSGRCAMFDAIDFQQRSWVPLSGWPLDRSELSVFVERARGYIGIQAYLDEAIANTYGGPRASDFPGAASALATFFWTFSRDEVDGFDHMRFGPAFLKRQQANVHLLMRATATHIETTEDGATVTGLELADRTGRRFKVKAPLVVLCGGGIENPRLLLASDRIVHGGLGNRHDVVGRYLMDHPKCVIAEFDPKSADTLRDSYSFFRLDSGAVIAAGFALSAETQERERLLNCSAWLDEERAVDDPFDAMKRLRKPGGQGRLLADVMAVLRGPAILLKGMHRRLRGRGVPHKLERLFLRAIVEQAPDPDSRLTLSDKTDALGVPLPKIDWRIGELERRSVARLAELVVSELPRLGFARPVLLENPELLDAAHPAGTTRMADDPTVGVVDRNCKVHGMRGLYVAGSSVFPTASHANPTLLIVGLAVRLADHLKEQLTRENVVVIRPKATSRVSRS